MVWMLYTWKQPQRYFEMGILISIRQFQVRPSKSTGKRDFLRLMLCLKDACLLYHQLAQTYLVFLLYLRGQSFTEKITA
jgi:hypothetical protein